MSRELILTTLLLCGSACTGEGAGAVSAQTEGLIWSGWNHTWSQLSHRIALAGAMQEPDGAVTMSMIGGDWSTGQNASDDLQFRMHHQDVQARGFAVAHGSTALTVGPDGLQRVQATVEDAAVAAQPHHAVLLRGFRIDTDVAQAAEYPSDVYDPALGYCSNGFGFGVDPEPQLDGDALSFEVWADVRWGPTGPDDPIDRSDMNSAIPFAQTGVVVGWTVVGFDGDLQRAEVSTSVDQPHDPPYSDQFTLGAADLPLGLSPTGRAGFGGLQAVDLDVRVQDVEVQGEYLRSMGAELQHGGVEPIELLTEVTNSSAFETAAITFSPTIELAWIELLDPAATVSAGVVEGLHEVGEHSISP